MRVIPTTAYVGIVHQENMKRSNEGNRTAEESANYFQAKILMHHTLITQDLEMWMVLPCDQDGNLIEKPLRKNLFIGDVPEDHEGPVYCDEDEFDYFTDQYEQAKARCLFEGFVPGFIGNEYIVADHEQYQFGFHADTGKYKGSQRVTVENLAYLEIDMTEAGIEAIGYDKPEEETQPNE